MKNINQDINSTTRAPRPSKEAHISDLQDNLPSGDEATGTTLNPQEGGKMEEPTIISELQAQYAKHVRKSYGTDKMTKAKSLQVFRTDNRDLHTALTAQVEDMESSVDDIKDNLDRLAMADEIKLINDQIERLDRILVAINDQGDVLLKA